MQLRGIQDGAALGGGIRKSVRRVMIEVWILWLHVVLLVVGKRMVCIRHEVAGYIACRRRGEGNPLLNSCALFFWLFWQSDVSVCSSCTGGRASGAPPILIDLMMIESPHKMEVPVGTTDPAGIYYLGRDLFRSSDVKCPANTSLFPDGPTGPTHCPSDGGENNSVWFRSGTYYFRRSTRLSFNLRHTNQNQITQNLHGIYLS